MSTQGSSGSRVGFVQRLVGPKSFTYQGFVANSLRLPLPVAPHHDPASAAPDSPDKITLSFQPRKGHSLPASSHEHRQPCLDFGGATHSFLEHTQGGEVWGRQQRVAQLVWLNSLLLKIRLGEASPSSEVRPPSNPFRGIPGLSRWPQHGALQAHFLSHTHTHTCAQHRCKCTPTVTLNTYTHSPLSMQMDTPVQGRRLQRTHAYPAPLPAPALTISVAHPHPQNQPAAAGPHHPRLHQLQHGGRVAGGHQDGAVQGELRQCRLHLLRCRVTDDDGVSAPLPPPSVTNTPPLPSHQAGASGGRGIGSVQAGMCGTQEQDGQLWSHVEIDTQVCLRPRANQHLPEPQFSSVNRRLLVRSKGSKVSGYFMNASSLLLPWSRGDPMHLRVLTPPHVLLPSPLVTPTPRIHPLTPSLTLFSRKPLEKPRQLSPFPRPTPTPTFP